MLQLLALLFILVPALEIYILFQFAGNFGAFNTFLFIIITGVLGAALARKEGLSVINNIQNELSQSKLPANEMISALLVFGGGLLLLTPGFLTDFLGFSMIFPLTRNFYIITFKELFKKGVLKGNIKVFTSASRFSQSGESHSAQKVEDTIEAEYSKK